MSSILEQDIVLHLNNLWLPLGYVTVEKAMNMLFSVSASTGHPSALAMDVAYEQLADGSLNVGSGGVPSLVSIEEWLTLPVRPFDRSLGTPKGRIRVPTIIVSVNYDDMPLSTPKCTKRRIRERDGSICQVTNQKIAAHEGNIDHIHAVSRGGKTTWENCVWVRRDINSKKGARTLREAGLRLIRKPVAPPAVPLCAKVRQVYHPDHKLIVKSAA